MSDKNAVAILLATYNGEKYLPTQIESIVKQDYTNWKIFISDDGSTDNTLSVVKNYIESYPDKIELLEKEKPTGSAKKNFMYMIKKASAFNYVMCCDQDDFWMPNKISITLEKMKELENGNQNVPCLVHTDLEVVDGELKTLATSFFEFSTLDKEGYALNQLLIQNIVTGCTMMVNKSLVEYASKECQIDNILMHDWWFALIASCFGRIGFVNEPTIRYRQHGNNSVGAKNSKDYSFIMAQIKKGKQNQKSIENTMLQAREFVETFSDKLKEKKQEYELIIGYAELLSAGKWKRLFYVIRNNIWKNGLARKVAEIIYL